VIRAIRILTAALLTAGILVSPSGRPAASTPEAVQPRTSAETVSGMDVLALNFKGTARREETPEPHRFQWTTDVYSMVSGEKVGTATHNVLPITPFSGDLVTTFHFPDGDLVAHSTESIMPSVLHPGFFHVGVHPKDNNIVPGKGTGKYAGRTGKVQMSGWHDCNTQCPEQATFDDFYLIELDAQP
jgi:hypothetical protein